MALAAFLRGVNVGGRRTFRPSVIANALREFDVVNVGAAGTFVARGKVTQTKFKAALLEQMPFVTEVALCTGQDLLQLETKHAFGPKPAPPDVVRFVSILVKSGPVPFNLPLHLPEEEWLVRVISADGRYVFGEYRRHMKTIGYLGQLDRLFGATATTRNWNTIQAVMRLLKAKKVK